MSHSPILYLTTHSDMIGKYNDLKRELIHSVSIYNTEMGLALGEKFEEFNTLVEICHAANDEARLRQYEEEFQAKNFSEFHYGWLLLNGEKYKLLTQPNLEALDQFTPRHTELAWMHYINTDQWENAEKCLAQLCSNEAESLQRKMAYTSMAKLAGLAGDEGARK